MRRWLCHQRIGVMLWTPPDYLTVIDIKIEDDGAQHGTLGDTEGHLNGTGKFVIYLKKLLSLGKIASNPSEVGFGKTNLVHLF